MADVGFNWTSDPSKVLEDMKKVVDGLKQVGDGAKKTARESKTTQKSGGDMALAWAKNLAGVAAQYVSIRTVLGQVNNALREKDRLEREAAARQRQAGGSASELLQLGLGDPARERRLMASARQTFAEGGGGTSLDEAQRITFDIYSAGQEAYRKTYSDLYGIIADPGRMATAVNTVTSNFPKEQNVRRVISGALAASEFAPAKADELLTALSSGAGQAAAMGISFPDYLAATTTASKAAGSADVGGTISAAFINALEQAPEYKRGTLGKSAQAMLSAGDAAPEGIRNLISERRARRGFFALAYNQAETEQIRRSVMAGMDSDLASRVVSGRDRIPEAGLMRREAVAAAEAYFADERGGTAVRVADMYRQKRRIENEEMVARSITPRIEQAAANPFLSALMEGSPGLPFKAAQAKVLGRAMPHIYSAGQYLTQRIGGSESFLRRVAPEEASKVEEYLEQIKGFEEERTRLAREERAANTGTKQIPRTSHSE